MMSSLKKKNNPRWCHEGHLSLGLENYTLKIPPQGRPFFFFHAKMSWQSMEWLSRHVREKEKKQKCQRAHDARRQVRGSTNQYHSSSSDHVCTNFKAIHPIAVQRSESGPKLWNETRINIVLEQCPPPHHGRKNSATSQIPRHLLSRLRGCSP